MNCEAGTGSVIQSDYLGAGGVACKDVLCSARLRHLHHGCYHVLAFLFWPQPSSGASLLARPSSPACSCPSECRRLAPLGTSSSVGNAFSLAKHCSRCCRRKSGCTESRRRMIITRTTPGRRRSALAPSRPESRWQTTNPPATRPGRELSDGMTRFSTLPGPSASESPPQKSRHELHNFPRD